MARINSGTVVTAVFAVLLLIAGSQGSWSQTGHQLKGLPNFGRVSENLYRAGQPTSDGFNTLPAMGVKIVVNFRENGAETVKERREVESLGIKYVGIPWSANREPSSAQIVEFLDLVRANPSTKILAHCRRGADRTGVMIAAYRISVEHKSVTEAVSEMHRFHYDWLFRPHLKRYIESLPRLLRNDPEFAAYNPQPSGTP